MAKYGYHLGKKYWNVRDSDGQFAKGWGIGSISKITELKLPSIEGNYTALEKKNLRAKRRKLGQKMLDTGHPPALVKAVLSDSPEDWPELNEIKTFKGYDDPKTPEVEGPPEPKVSEQKPWAQMTDAEKAQADKELNPTPDDEVAEEVMALLPEDPTNEDIAKALDEVMPKHPMTLYHTISTLVDQKLAEKAEDDEELSAEDFDEIMSDALTTFAGEGSTTEKEIKDVLYAHGIEPTEANVAHAVASLEDVGIEVKKPEAPAAKPAKAEGLKTAKTDKVLGSSSKYKLTGDPQEVTLDGEVIGYIAKGKVGGPVMNGKINVGWQAESSGWLLFDKNGSRIQGQYLTESTKADALAALQAKSKPATEAKPAPEKAPEAPETPSLGDVQDVSGWEQVGGQKGSNAGGLYEAPDGQQYYVKVAQSEDHAKSEVLANALYAALGVDSPEVSLGTKDGKLQIVSKIVDGATSDFSAKLSDKDYKAKVQEGFISDAWMANWDVAGLGMDNVVTGADGKPYRIDAGGALQYRAQGKSKGSQFGNTVPEFDTMRDSSKNAQAAKVFGDMTPEQIKESAAKLEALSDADIEGIVASVYGADGGPMANKLKKRKADVLAKVNALGGVEAPKAPEAANALTLDQIEAKLSASAWKKSKKGFDKLIAASEDNWPDIYNSLNGPTKWGVDQLLKVPSPGKMGEKKQAILDKLNSSSQPKASSTPTAQKALLDSLNAIDQANLNDQQKHSLNLIKKDLIENTPKEAMLDVYKKTIDAIADSPNAKAPAGKTGLAKPLPDLKTQLKNAANQAAQYNQIGTWAKESGPAELQAAAAEILKGGKKGTPASLKNWAMAVNTFQPAATPEESWNNLLTASKGPSHTYSPKDVYGKAPKGTFKFDHVLASWDEGKQQEFAKYLDETNLGAAYWSQQKELKQWAANKLGKEVAKPASVLKPSAPTAAENNKATKALNSIDSKLGSNWSNLNFNSWVHNTSPDNVQAAAEKINKSPGFAKHDELKQWASAVKEFTPGEGFLSDDLQKVVDKLEQGKGLFGDKLPTGASDAAIAVDAHVFQIMGSWDKDQQANAVKLIKNHPAIQNGDPAKAGALKTWAALSQKGKTQPAKDMLNGANTNAPTTNSFSSYDYNASFKDLKAKMTDTAHKAAYKKLSTQEKVALAALGNDPEVAALLEKDHEETPWALASNLPKVETANKAQHDALKSYTGSGYSSINKALRTGEDPSPSTKKKINQIDSFFAQESTKLTQDVVLVRGINTNDHVAKAFGLNAGDLGGYGGSKKLLEHADKVVGKTFLEKGYMSTAFQSSENSSGMAGFANSSAINLRILAPAGTKAANIKPISNYKSENEVLVDRNAKMVITDVYELNGAVWVDTVLVSSEHNKKKV